MENTPTTPTSGIPGFDRPPKPDNYLWQAIVVTLLCCLPTGIAAIVFSSRVDSKYIAGDYAGAAADAAKAKQWTIYSVIAGAIVVVLYFGFIFLIAGGAMMGAMK